jgi:DNA-binding transcriptional LysR family regulator
VNSLQQKASTLGLTPRRALPRRIEGRVFLRQRYALFCGRHHPFFGRGDLTLADVASQPFVSFSGDKVGDHMSPLTIFRDEMGFTGRLVASSSSMSEIKRFIFSGIGVGCLPAHVVGNEVEQKRFQKLPPDEGVADVDIYFLWSQDRKFNAAETAFIDALHAFIDQQDASGEHRIT